MRVAAALALADLDWGDHMDGWGAGAWLVMVVGMILFWALVIVCIVWLVRTNPWSGPKSGEGSAMELLDRRFAAGEISSDEYRQRRAVLRGEDPP